MQYDYEKKLYYFQKNHFEKTDSKIIILETSKILSDIKDELGIEVIAFSILPK